MRKPISSKKEKQKKKTDTTGLTALERELLSYVEQLNATSNGSADTLKKLERNSMILFESMLCAHLDLVRFLIRNISEDLSKEQLASKLLKQWEIYLPLQKRLKAKLTEKENE